MINGTELRGGEKRAAETGKEFRFLIEAEGTMLQIECLDATAGVEFIGGAPGTDKGAMTFAGETSGETIVFGAMLSELEFIRKNKEGKEVAKYPTVVKTAQA